MSVSHVSPMQAPRRRGGMAAGIGAVAVFVVSITGCAVGPNYSRPSAPTSATFKEAQTEAGATWLPAAPADALDRGDWWTLFGDDDLSRLAVDVDTANQTVAQAVASYRQAQALVREARASYFPTLGLNLTARRSGARGTTPVNAFGLSADGDWAPDFWGRVGRAVEGAEASRQATAADLAAARLSAQGEMATDYFSLREADAEIALLATTIEGYERALQITQNRYAAGIAPKTDVLQAQTQLATTQADLATTRSNRARFEHAIAVLTGKAPGDFTLPVMAWKQTVPAVPLGVPSALLQRRPDIASSERQVAAANAQIGVEASAYFPNLTLSASLGNGGSRIGNLFSVSTAMWSVGVGVAQVLFDGGAISARIAAAEAARDVATARYRQTVLTAFQGVEDELSTSRYLAEQSDLRKLASDAADQTEQQILNRYRAGQLSYTDVVTAQASALAARRALIGVAVARQTTAIALIQALGGGWTVDAPVETKSSVVADNPR